MADMSTEKLEQIEKAEKEFDRRFVIEAYMQEIKGA